MNRFQLIGLFLILQFLSMMVAVKVLGTAIQWPKSLGYPAEQSMKLILGHPMELKIGYLFYFLSTYLTVPIFFLIKYSEKNEKYRALINFSIAFGVFAILFKTLGIMRWLTIQPYVAQAFQDTGHEFYISIYDIVNLYFGAIGEVLGVFLCMGIWTITSNLYFFRSGNFSSIFSILGLILGFVLILGSIKLLGIELPTFYTLLTGVGWQVWAFLFGLYLVYFKRKS